MTPSFETTMVVKNLGSVSALRFPGTGIHDGDGRQKLDALPDHLHEVFHHATEPRHARRLHDEVLGVECVGDREHRGGEVLPTRAADAVLDRLPHLDVRVGPQAPGVDIGLTVLVLVDNDVLARAVHELLDERRLARAQKSRDDKDPHYAIPPGDASGMKKGPPHEAMAPDRRDELVDHDDRLDEIGGLVPHEEERLLKVVPAVERMRDLGVQVEAAGRDEAGKLLHAQAAAGHEATTDVAP